jgi:hypothetical protein
MRIVHTYDLRARSGLGCLGDGYKDASVHHRTVPLSAASIV